MVGKTCMLITYTKGAFPEHYVPTIFDNHVTHLTVDGNQYQITLWDTTGNEDYAGLRQLSYPKTNCFILCYSIQERTSFDNVLHKWSPELKHYAPNCPILLVGTKLDLRIEGSPIFVTEAEGRKMKTRIRASGFLECSARNQVNLIELFREAVRIVESSKNVKAQNCSLL